MGTVSPSIQGRRRTRCDGRSDSVSVMAACVVLAAYAATLEKNIEIVCSCSLAIFNIWCVILSNRLDKPLRISDI
jgi:hypothetical protein